MPSPTTSRKSASPEIDARLPFAGKTLEGEDVMSCAQILWWLRELSTNPHWGWSRNKTNLARALGFRSNPRGAIGSKLGGSWIWPSEQIRLSHRIRMIVNGELVPLYDRFPNGYEYANPPRPVGKPPAQLRVSRTIHGPMLHVEQFKQPTVALPDFKSVFSRARLWKTD